MIKLFVGVLVGWLGANLVAGMRPASWLELVDELGAKLVVRLEEKFGVLDKPRDWEG